MPLRGTWSFKEVLNPCYGCNGSGLMSGIIVCVLHENFGVPGLGPEERESLVEGNTAIRYYHTVALCVCVQLLTVLGSEAWPSQGHAVGAFPVLLAQAVPDSVLLVHHLLQQRLVVSVQRSHRDVPHGSELTTVIQVLVLQTEEVPHKTSAVERGGEEENRVKCC